MTSETKTTETERTTETKTKTKTKKGAGRPKGVKNTNRPSKETVMEKSTEMISVLFNVLQTHIDEETLSEEDKEIYNEMLDEMLDILRSRSIEKHLKKIKIL